MGFLALLSKLLDKDVFVNANQSNFSRARWLNEMGESSSHHEVVFSMLGLSIQSQQAKVHSISNLKHGTRYVDFNVIRTEAYLQDLQQLLLMEAVRDPLKQIPCGGATKLGKQDFLFRREAFPIN